MWAVVTVLDKYLNQTVQHYVKTGTNSAAQPTYANPVSIAARKENRIRYVRSTTGQQVVSNTTVFTTVAVALEDKIDGLKVIDVLNMVDRSGNVVGYEVLL